MLSLAARKLLSPFTSIDSPGRFYGAIHRCQPTSQDVASLAAEAQPLKTIVLIDFENVQPKSLASLRGRQVTVKIFIGANQTKIPADLRTPDLTRLSNT